MKKINLACIIDDDPIFVFTAKKILSSGKICDDLLIFKNGKDALEGLESLIKEKQHLPDLILLDLNMPIMNGWQFLDRFIDIKNSDKIPVFIASSSIDPLDLEKAKSYKNVTDYVLKPISRKGLEKIVDSL